MQIVLSDEYVKNPRLQLYYDRSSTGEVVGLRVLAPNKRRGLQVLRMPVKNKLFTSLEVFLGSDSEESVKRLPADLADLLVGTSVLIQEDNVSNLVTCACQLNSQMPDIVGIGAVDKDHDTHNLVMNPSIVEAGCRQTDECLVKDPMTGIVVRYRLSDRYRDVYEKLMRHDVSPGEINADERQVFRNAGILVAPDSVTHQDTKRRRQIDYAADQYRGQGFAVIRKLITSYYLSSLQRYYKALFDEGYARYYDALADRRFQIFNEHYADRIQQESAPFVSAIIGQAMRPSYCFAFFYRKQACLPRHVDRDDFSVALSIAIQYAPYDSEADAWPLYLSMDEDEASLCEVRVEPGAAVLFNGARLYHERKRFTGEWFTNLVLGYVPE